MSAIGGGSTAIRTAVATPSDLPIPSVDGSLCVSIATDELYEFDGATNTWVLIGPGGGGGGGGSPSNTVVHEQAYGQAPNSGVSALYSRADHTHGTPPNTLAGDVTGTFAVSVVSMVGGTLATTIAANSPTTTQKAALAGTSGTPSVTNKFVTDVDPRLIGGASVVTETAYNQASTAGVATTFSKSDHTHGTPSDANIPTTAQKAALAGTNGTPGVSNAYVTNSDPRLGAGGTPAVTVVSETSYGQAPVVGTATTYARADHSHGTPAAPAVMTGANGVVAGAAGLVPAPAATDNTKFLRGDGSWQPASGGASDYAGYFVSNTIGTGDIGTSMWGWWLNTSVLPNKLMLVRNVSGVLFGVETNPL